MATTSRWDATAEEAIEEATAPYEEETLESLEEKLAEYRENLRGIEEALFLSPDEPELAKLLKDLRELVALYEDLVQLRKSEQPEAKRRHLGNEGPALATVAGNLKSVLSRTCYAMYEGTLYTGVVVDVQADPETGAVKITVEYIGWGNRESLPLDSVQFVPSVPNLKVGTPCYAISPRDGMWHLAQVSQVQADNARYSVRFKHSHETAPVAFDQVSVRTPHAVIASTTAPGAGADGDSKRQPREIITPGGYRIPEKFAIKPHDSEKVKQMKRKKITLIKKEQRKELIEAEFRTRQSNWQAHSQQTTRKMHAPKVSIFRTSDVPEGKVGVTGSGQKMTQFSTRVRHVFNEAQDEEPQ